MSQTIAQIETAPAIRRVAAKYLLPRYSVSLVRSGTVHYHRQRVNDTEGAIGLIESICQRELEDEPREVFAIVTLDTKMQPIGFHPITCGVLDSSLVHPREVFAAAIMANARSIFLVHNHPSGDLMPSSADLSVTERLVKSGHLLGIHVMDHFIVGVDADNRFRARSMRAMGFNFTAELEFVSGR